METATPSPFIATLLVQHKEWRELPIVKRAGKGWRGSALTIQPPSGSDIAFGLDVEEVGDEITVSFDYAHAHLAWPPNARGLLDPIWWDASALIDAILEERVVASSGWIDGELRVGSLHEADRAPDLLVPAVQKLRVRSWLGTFNRDELLQTPHVRD